MQNSFYILLYNTWESYKDFLIFTETLVIFIFYNKLLTKIIYTVSAKK